MNRRDALKLLAGLPLLVFLKPEAVEASDKFKQAQLELIETIKKIEPNGEIFFDIVEELPRPKAVPGKDLMIEFENGARIQGCYDLQSGDEPVTRGVHIARWNGAGGSWESTDSGQTWTQTGFAPVYTGEVEIVEGEELWLKWNSNSNP